MQYYLQVCTYAALPESSHLEFKSTQNVLKRIVQLMPGLNIRLWDKVCQLIWRKRICGMKINLFGLFVFAKLADNAISEIRWILTIEQIPR